MIGRIDDNKFHVLLRKGWRATEAAQVFGCQKTAGYPAKCRVIKNAKNLHPALFKIIWLAGPSYLTEEQLFEMIDLFYEAENIGKNGDRKIRFP